MISRSEVSKKCCSTRRWLMTVCAIQLALSMQRQIIDFMGTMWLVVLFNFITILAAIVGLFGAMNHRSSHMIVFLIWAIVGVLFNSFIIAFYMELAGLQRTGPELSLGTGSQSWWLTNGPDCIPLHYPSTALVDHGTSASNMYDMKDANNSDTYENQLSYRVSNDTSIIQPTESPPEMPAFSHDMDQPVTAVAYSCSIEFYWIETIQAICHILLAILSIVLTSYALYEKSQEDDSSTARRSIAGMSAYVLPPYSTNGFSNPNGGITNIRDGSTAGSVLYGRTPSIGSNSISRLNPNPCPYPVPHMPDPLQPRITSTSASLRRPSKNSNKNNGTGTVQRNTAVRASQYSMSSLRSTNHRRQKSERRQKAENMARNRASYAGTTSASERAVPVESPYGQTTYATPSKSRLQSSTRNTLKKDVYGPRSSSPINDTYTLTRSVNQQENSQATNSLRRSTAERKSRRKERKSSQSQEPVYASRPSSSVPPPQEPQPAERSSYRRSSTRSRSSHKRRSQRQNRSTDRLLDNGSRRQSVATTGSYDHLADGASAGGTLSRRSRLDSHTHTLSQLSINNPSSRHSLAAISITSNQPPPSYSTHNLADGSQYSLHNGNDMNANVSVPPSPMTRMMNSSYDVSSIDSWYNNNATAPCIPNNIPNGPTSYSNPGLDNSGSRYSVYSNSSSVGQQHQHGLPSQSNGISLDPMASNMNRNQPSTSHSGNQMNRAQNKYTAQNQNGNSFPHPPSVPHTSGYSAQHHVNEFKPQSSGYNQRHNSNQQAAQTYSSSPATNLPHPSPTPPLGKSSFKTNQPFYQNAQEATSGEYLTIRTTLNSSNPTNNSYSYSNAGKTTFISSPSSRSGQTSQQNGHIVGRPPPVPVRRSPGNYYNGNTETSM